MKNSRGTVPDADAFSEDKSAGVLLRGERYSRFYPRELAEDFLPLPREIAAVFFPASLVSDTEDGINYGMENYVQSASVNDRSAGNAAEGRGGAASLVRPPGKSQS